ncbi:MAG: PHP-associated domain-containing protein [Clostridiales bacterium]|nr:PHP-associated domain-containing protein [Clostridiales bacterium]
MSYKLETHLHTYEGSRCSTASGEIQAVCRKEDGYDGIIVTDHLFKGNTRPDRNLPWHEYVDLFCKGYENAKKKGDEIGLDVFFGWEDNFNGAEMLVYGLDKSFLYRHPDIRTWDAATHYRIVHEAGGFVVQAHPFRLRSYQTGIFLYPEYCDAIELVNKSNKPEENERAAWYAKQYDLAVTGGSDIHGCDSLFGGMVFERNIITIGDYIDAIKNREGFIL